MSELPRLVSEKDRQDVLWYSTDSFEVRLEQDVHVLSCCLEMVTWHVASLPLVHQVVRLAICEARPANIWLERLAQEVEEGQ